MVPILVSAVSAAIFMAFLALGVSALRRHWNRRRETWNTFASRHDWGFSEKWGAVEVQGLFLGQQLSVLTESRGNGKHGREVTVLRLDLGMTLPPELTLSPEGLGDKFLKLFGGKDEEVGDEELDRALDVKRLSPESRAALRAPRVREHLLSLHARCARFSIEAGLLEAEWRGVPDTVDALEALVAPALRLAEALHEAAGKHRESTGQTSPGAR
ncbi:hypothetical protein [Myxococcus sp. RHSTA-1-4]|uniref:hypothetical protein n=1 Tax=Myxococcus sp. RHSTA-1-4 TaxID=2874601 RepID=UPI001CBAC77F|nr:hypothetical protein [Myxococcus sp. RHSTA-1-4]MBZ4415349.1 hypothetical protein [Myxococcus sp. RHSTA-1-4]